MRAVKYGFIILGLLLLTPGAYADLTINIVKGIDKPYPVAIVPFESSGMSISRELPQGIAGVVSSDLKMSGQFDLMSKTQFPQTPHAADAVNWAAWKKADSNVEFLIIGNVTAGSIPNTYTVSFQVLSVFGQRTLIGQLYQNIPQTQLRALAHYISDTIYQAITGVRGNFSTRLAYVEVLNQNQPRPTYRLMVSDADGYHPQMLLQQIDNPIASPIWSPDGKQLAYVSYVNNRMTIYTITLATGARQVVASFPGINSAPAWSPDGKTMAMALSKGDSSKTNLYLMNLNTRALTRLTSYATNTSPYFSPDGKRIIFTSDRGGSPQIYQLNIASGKVTRLSYDGVKNFSGMYTPDGQSMVFMYQATADSPIRIAVLNLISGQMRVLTQGELDKSPSIAPNGQMIVYANYDSYNGVLAETSLNGKIHLQLPATQGSVQSPAWSPFLN